MVYRTEDIQPRDGRRGLASEFLELTLKLDLKDKCDFCLKEKRWGVFQSKDKGYKRQRVVQKSSLFREL